MVCHDFQAWSGGKGQSLRNILIREEPSLFYWQCHGGCIGFGESRSGKARRGHSKCLASEGGEGRKVKNCRK